jgi:magnesium-transporting ATPase (P-type)
VHLNQFDESLIALNRKFGANGIRTSKFTALSFFPVNLFLQFNKASNIYFFLITIMQMIDLISISGGKPAMALPLAVVVLVSMVKDAFEDYKRHAADAKENDSQTLVFNA